MGKMNKSEVIEWLNEIAERSREAYVKTGDDIYRKDNDCIMSALEIIGQAGECKVVFAVQCSGDDASLMSELRSMLEKKQNSVKHSKESAKMMGRLMPGAGIFMPAVMGAVMDEADILQRVYVRMGQLLEASR